MKDFIRNKIREGIIIKEFIDAFRINDVEDDELYESLLKQADELSKNSEIGFGDAGLFGVLVNTDNKELAGATWLESSGNFTFHIIIKPNYRGKGLSRLLLDDLMDKYTQMKSYVGNDYKVVVNVVNEKLADTLAKHYAFKTIKDNGTGGVIMTNESVNITESKVIDIMKNTESAQNYGSRFGQDVEPSGTYVLHRDTDHVLDGWKIGKAVLENPLFVNITLDSQIEYKRDLANKYKAKGKVLTNKLMKLGHDSLITVYPDGQYGEIVLFPNSKFMLH
jgi:hypothetical protein